MYVGLLVGLSMCAILKWRRGARCDGFGSESLAIAERLAHSDPGNAGWQRDLSLSYAHLGYAYLKAEQFMKAREVLSIGRDIIAPLVAKFPDWPQWKQDLAWFDQQIAALKN